MHRNIHGRLGRLEAAAPSPDALEHPRPVMIKVPLRVIMPDGTTEYRDDPDTRRVTEAEAERRGWIFIPEDDDRPGLDDPDLCTPTRGY